MQKREHQTWMNELQILTLRGGGASGRRKEARKRKFKDRELEITGLKVESEAIQPHLNLPRQDESQPTSEPTDLHTTKTKQKPVETLTSKNSQRFIVFIGNLPFTTTVDSIRRHFAKVKPTSIRHSTAQDTAKSKGFAFLEFDNYDRMKTCLKLFHHSRFDDGVSASRQVNVELTAGGGGRSQARRTKLQAKNKKLNEERKRRAQDGKGAAKLKSPEKARTSPDDLIVHPSRRSRVANTRT